MYQNNRHRSGRNRSGGNRRQRFGGRKNFQSKDQSHAIRQFIEASQQQTTPQTQPEKTQTGSFAEFEFHPALGNALADLGFTQPTPIQGATIPHILGGKDVLGIAQTGTGKTGAFLMPTVHNLLNNQTSKGIVIAPTRELALQIFGVFKDLTQKSQLRAVACIGGSNMNRQIDQLKRDHHLVIGTPGRILDLINRRKIQVRDFELVVLDEVDRMLDMGFVHDITKILKDTPDHKQSLYFSATMNKRVNGLINQFSRDVHQVSIAQKLAAGTVQQEIVKYQSENTKFDTLYEILRAEDVTKSVIFGRTKHGVKKLMFKLRDQGFRTESIHGNKTQSQRKKALQSFKRSDVDILVATDVASRGLDVDDITHVINYDVPQSLDDYIHRVGRTGRAGKTGVAYTFLR